MTALSNDFICLNQLSGTSINIIDINDNNYNIKTGKAAAASTGKKLTH